MKHKSLYLHLLFLFLSFSLNSVVQAGPTDRYAVRKGKEVAGEHINIHLASRKGILLAVKSFLWAGGSPNKRDADGRTPLFMVGNLRTAKALVKAGAKINVRDKTGNTPLHFARTAEIAEYLLSQGADPNARDKRGDTPLHVAAQLGPIKGGSLIDVLVRYGAKPNSANKDGNVPLHISAGLGHKVTSNELMSSGARVNVRNKVGITPLHLASTQIEVKKPPKAYGIGYGMALAGGSIAGVGGVIVAAAAAGAIVATLTTAGTVLIVAGAVIAITGLVLFFSAIVAGALNLKAKVDLVKDLLESGADPNAQDIDGNTPLHYLYVAKATAEKSMFENFEEMEKALLDGGADPTIKNNDGKTPAMLAL